MSDVYVECLVRGKKSNASKVLCLFLIFMTAVFMGLLPFFSFSLILAAACGFGAYLANVSGNVEYEYLYLDKEITVDKIINQSRRKTVAVYNLDRMEVFAPAASSHLDNYRKREVKETDFSDWLREDENDVYVMYYEGGKKVLFSPSKEFVNALYNAAPRKVFQS